MMQALYHDTWLTRGQVERLAGGPTRCASQPGIMARIPGLAEFVDARIDQLTGRIRMIICSFPADGVTATIISNALPYMFTAVRMPGMPPPRQQRRRTERPRPAGGGTPQGQVPQLEGRPKLFHPLDVRGRLREERHIRLPCHHPDGMRSNPEHHHRRNTRSHLRWGKDEQAASAESDPA